MCHSYCIDTRNPKWALKMQFGILSCLSTCSFKSEFSYALVHKYYGGWTARLWGTSKNKCEHLGTLKWEGHVKQTAGLEGMQFSMLTPRSTMIQHVQWNWVCVDVDIFKQIEWHPKRNWPQAGWQTTQLTPRVNISYYHIDDIQTVSPIIHRGRSFNIPPERPSDAL